MNTSIITSPRPRRAMEDWWRKILLQSLLEMQTLSHGRMRIFWEVHLVKRGLLPVLPFVGVTNDRFGFIEDGQWKEWAIPSVESLRTFWSRLSCDSDPLFDLLLSFLPGSKQTCMVCQWSHIPITAMYSEHTCCSCRKQPLPTQ